MQGKQNTLEYVSEYLMQYSDNGEVWRTYRGPGGEAKVPVGGRSVICQSF